MRTIKVSGISDSVYEALRQECREKGLSMNELILSCLEVGFSRRPTGIRYDDLDEFFGSWNERPFREFEKAVEVFGKVEQAF